MFKEKSWKIDESPDEVDGIRRIVVSCDRLRQVGVRRTDALRLWMAGGLCRKLRRRGIN